MKQRIFLFLLAALFVQCKLDSQSGGLGSIKGEGEVVKKEISLDAFHGVQLSISGDVVLTQGSPQKVVIEGQQNIIDNIRKTVKDGAWNITNEKNVRDGKPVTFYITMPTFTEVSLAGSGHIKSASTFTGLQDVDLNIAGSGDIQLAMESKSVDASVSGSGGVKLEGMTQMLDIAISGTGNVMAQNLTATACEVSISGSGDAEVNVNGDLKTAISGSGDVRYKGNANVNARISGSGEVSKM